jgi:hypothetical protein
VDLSTTGLYNLANRKGPRPDVHFTQGDRWCLVSKGFLKFTYSRIVDDSDHVLMRMSTWSKHKSKQRPTSASGLTDKQIATPIGPR